MVDSVSRYYVSELEGYPDATAKRSEPGLSCMVIDSLICKQVMVTYCTEDLWQGMPRMHKRTKIRRLAAEHCAQLNAEAA